MLTEMLFSRGVIQFSIYRIFFLLWSEKSNCSMIHVWKEKAFLPSTNFKKRPSHSYNLDNQEWLGVQQNILTAVILEPLSYWQGARRRKNTSCFFFKSFSFQACPCRAVDWKPASTSSKQLISINRRVLFFPVSKKQTAQTNNVTIVNDCQLK